jgi:Zn-dependent protease
MPRRRVLAPRSLQGVRIARVFGIDLTVHSSWLVSLAILSFVSYDLVVRELVRDAPFGVRSILAVAFALVIAWCIIGHELAHCVVARAYGLRVRRITLFAFGGVSQIDQEAATPASEFFIALAGPLASIVLATALGLIARLLNPGTPSLLGAWGRLAEINLALAIFNLIPAFPMDGGRILRSGLWAGARDRARATRWAVAAARSFAFLLMGAGAVLLLRPHGGDRMPGGVWTLAIGAFIYSMAGSAGRAEGGRTPNEGAPPERLKR